MFHVEHNDKIAEVFHVEHSQNSKGLIRHSLARAPWLTAGFRSAQKVDLTAREKSIAVPIKVSPYGGRVAHLSFFERWDSTSLSRLGFMDSADASQVLYFSGNRRR